MLVALVLSVVTLAPPVGPPTNEVTIQGDDVSHRSRVCARCGWHSDPRLGIIKAIGVQLTSSQRKALEKMDGVTRVYDKLNWKVVGMPKPDTIESSCANQGLNIANDLADIEHYGGWADQDEYGNYYIMDLDGCAWSGSYAWSGDYAWSGSYAWSTASMTINVWIPQEQVAKLSASG